VRFTKAQILTVRQRFRVRSGSSAFIVGGEQETALLTGFAVAP
jgi:hypothetical protein